MTDVESEEMDFMYGPVAGMRKDTMILSMIDDLTHEGERAEDGSSVHKKAEVVLVPPIHNLGFTVLEV